MKTIHSLIILVLLSFSLQAQTLADLKFNLEKNKVYRVKSTSEQAILQTVNGTQQSNEINTSTVLSFKPISSDANGIVAETRFDTIIYSISMPKMNLNSSKAGNMKSTDPSEVMACIFNRLSNAVLVVKMTYTGNIIEISNIKTVTDSILKGIDSLKGQNNQMILGRAKSMVNEEALKGMIESVTAYLPGKKVKIGDKWESKINMSSAGFGMLVTSNYKLKKITGDRSEISGDVTIEPASSDPINMNGIQITPDIRGLSTSSLTVDNKTGWIIKSSSKSHSQGNLNVKAGGNDMQIPMEIDGKSESVVLQ
jgi:hypothetical protein